MKNFLTAEKTLSLLNQSKKERVDACVIELKPFWKDDAQCHLHVDKTIRSVANKYLEN